MQAPVDYTAIYAPYKSVEGSIQVYHLLYSLKSRYTVQVNNRKIPLMLTKLLIIISHTPANNPETLISEGRQSDNAISVQEDRTILKTFCK